MAKSLTIPPLTEDLAQVLIDADTINRRVTELAIQINNDYRDITEPLILIGVLKGSFIFLSDLCRKLTIPHVVDFIAISSYGNKGEVQGNVRMLMDIREDMAGRDVLIVEDILDTGNTLKYIHDMLSKRNPESIGVVTLLDKPARRVADIKADYVGTDVPDAFVVGYGLDYDQEYRNIPYIGSLKREIYE